MSTRIMVDLETLGTNAGAVILSIGACKFAGGVITETFYERVDPDSCVAAGLHLEVGAVMWWLAQSDDARLEVTKPGQPLRQVLEWFSAWVADPDPEMWGNGATFDNVVLAAAYDAIGLSRPWRFPKDRCYRTVKNLHPEVPMVRTGTHHNALEDAKSQAIHLMTMLGESPLYSLGGQEIAASIPEVASVKSVTQHDR